MLKNLSLVAILYYQQITGLSNREIETLNGGALHPNSEDLSSFAGMVCQEALSSVLGLETGVLR